MKKILIAAALIFTTVIISSCSKPGNVNSTEGRNTQVILNGAKKDLGSAD
jgi:PBP1b-binding outer membrane lipoprotein LpoB